MKNIKHRKFTIGSLTSLACFNVIRQKWAAKAVFSWGSCSSSCHVALLRVLFHRNPSWHKQAKTPLETLIFGITVMGKMSLTQGLLTTWLTWGLQVWLNLKNRDWWRLQTLHWPLIQQLWWGTVLTHQHPFTPAGGSSPCSHSFPYSLKTTFN